MDAGQEIGSGYVVEERRPTCPEDGGGNLLTDEEFADFVFRFEFKLTPGGNNGIGIRAPLRETSHIRGWRSRVLDHDNEKYKGTLKPTQRHGSVYDVFPALPRGAEAVGRVESRRRSPPRSEDQGGAERQDSSDADVSTVTDPEVLKKHPGLHRKSGRIGFLGHKSHVEFRNISIKRL